MAATTTSPIVEDFDNLVGLLHDLKRAEDAACEQAQRILDELAANGIEPARWFVAVESELQSLLDQVAGHSESEYQGADPLVARAVEAKALLCAAFAEEGVSEARVP